jgi:hypothetical protein
MGRKQDRSRKQIHFCIAVLISISMAGCSFGSLNSIKESGPKEINPPMHLALGRTLFGKGDFSGALREFEKVPSSAVCSDANQEALLYTGLIYIDPANPGKDHGKSIIFFKKLADGCPKSPFAEQAKIIVTLMRENDESNRTIERLKGLIEASKKVDIGIENRKKETIR